MSRIDAQLLEHLQDIPVIDLHHLRPDEAIETMQHELYTLHVHKSPFCRIVHGVGSGKLQGIVHRELAKNPLIEAFFLDSHGGATTVRFYPHR